MKKMKTKSSKKILPATVFALVIVLSAFAVMCTTVSAQGFLNKTLDPIEGDLGDVVNVTINVTVGVGKNVTVEDTLPPEFTYIGNFTVDGKTETPLVEKRNISYNTITTSATHTIKFDVKVTKAYWENQTVCNEVAVYNETDVLIDNTTACFNITAFTDLYKDAEGPEEPVMGVEEKWKIGMGVTNNFSYTMNGTKITDRFGGDLKIDSINTTAGNYTFNYTDYKKKTAIVTIKNGTGIEIYSGDLDKKGVTIGDEPYEFHIFWTGKAHKAHFEWSIGDLAEKGEAGITINVSTDINPAGKKQGYTSTGPHELNSGATLKFKDPEQVQLSAVTAPIEVEAVEPVVP